MRGSSSIQLAFTSIDGRQRSNGMEMKLLGHIPHTPLRHPQVRVHEVLRKCVNRPGDPQQKDHSESIIARPPQGCQQRLVLCLCQSSLMLGPVVAAVLELHAHKSWGACSLGRQQQHNVRSRRRWSGRAKQVCGNRAGQARVCTSKHAKVCCNKVRAARSIPDGLQDDASSSVVARGSEKGKV